MGCERWEAALSALADGEAPGLDERLVAAHVARCPSCQAYQRDIVAIRSPFRIGPAAAVPDLSRHIAKTNALADRGSAWGLVLAALAVVAIAIVMLSLPLFFTSSDLHTDAVHTDKHVAAFSIAYAAGLFVVVARPARARTMLPVAAVLAVALLITALVDVFEGHAPLLRATVHLPEVASVLLIWLLARPSSYRHSTIAALRRRLVRSHASPVERRRVS
jgi:predicted anti-sigma-YlaC factor YlaD